MSIWKNGELLEHAYEKTLVATNGTLIIWLDGTNTKLDFHKEHCGKKHYILKSEFGMCGGSINTNSGISLTKEHLLEIANKMKEGATLKIAACDALYLTKESLKYSQCNETVEESFEKDNSMVKCGGNSFKYVPKS